VTDWSAVLAHAFEAQCGRRGDTGDTGAKCNKALEQISILPIAPGALPPDEGVTWVTPLPPDEGVTWVTPLSDEFVTPVTPRLVDRGDKPAGSISSAIQIHGREGTPVTPVTRQFGPLAVCAIDRLTKVTPPEGFGAETWQRFLVDARSFLDRWAEEAELLGWTDECLFGVDALAPAARFDVMGLVLLIGGGEVTELDRRRATIRSRRGSLLVYRKPLNSTAVALWNLVPAMNA
jgi:hypothetical protein